jgi:hypothetical protein
MIEVSIRATKLTEEILMIRVANKKRRNIVVQKMKKMI